MGKLISKQILILETKIQNRTLNHKYKASSQIVMKNLI